MVIAHLSDLHLHARGLIRPLDLASRRLFGAANLYLARQGIHSVRAVVAAVKAVREAGADHAVVTGDLGNLGLESEFALAADVLEPLGGYDRLTIVPGNHDYYTGGAVRAQRFEHAFGRLLWPDGRGEYPAIKDLGGVRLVAMRTAILPPPLCSFGEAGADQTALARAAVAEGAAQGRFTVVLLHHNLNRRGWVNETTGRLLDRERLVATLAAAGADLVLQGHDHRPRDFGVPRPRGGEMRVIGCGSTSLDAPATGLLGRFNVYAIEGNKLAVERWQLRPLDGRFRPLPE
jgi:3',5'-cyclic AMP phosphodiesterase CpdA